MKPELQRRVQRYGWDKAAEVYEPSWKELLKPAQQRVLEVANLKPGERVIETACGTGLITFDAADQVKPGGEVLATDISEEMVVKTKEEAEIKGYDNITAKRMDAEQLDEEDDSFDVAISALGLMYYTDPLQGLKEKYRVIKPEGRAAMVIWGDRKKCGWAEIFPIVDQYVASEVCPMFFQQGTGNTLEKTMQMAGFVDISTERFDTTLNYESSEHCIKAAFAGGPVALAYQKFDDETKEKAHEEYLASVEPFRNGEGYVVPGEFVVAVGFKQ